jgi:hypothetical protein
MGDNQSDNNTDSDHNREEDQPPNDLKDMAGSEQEDDPDSDSDLEFDHLYYSRLQKGWGSLILEI